MANGIISLINSDHDINNMNCVECDGGCDDIPCDCDCDCYDCVEYE